MSHEIVHAIGSTVYFIFFLLFLWVSRVQRTNPGAEWWATAMLCALLARLVLLLAASHGDKQLLSAAYSALNALEKLFLVLGLARFFGLTVPVRWVLIAATTVEFWIFASWVGEFPPMFSSIGLAAFNASVLVFVARVTYLQRNNLHPQLMLVTSAASVLLVLHWVPGYLLVSIAPQWYPQGFMLGTALVLIQYFSLLIALLISFQKRLLDAESKALDMAFEDPLTGLNNKRYLTTLIDKVLALATRSQQTVALIYIDIDNFKPINDRDGHSVGDEVLKTVARRLKASTRSSDMCIRIGGDEFAAICSQLQDQQQAHDIVKKIMCEISSPITVKGRAYFLSVSVGVSLYPLHGDSLTALLEFADNAMYQIKRSGKNGYQMHDDGQTSIEVST